MFDDASLLAKNKLKILYLFYTLNIPINNIDITKFVLEKDYLDYFSLQKILRDLIEDGFIEVYKENNINFYSLTNNGKETVSMFMDKIPKLYKESINKNFKSLKKDTQKKKELVGHYFQRKDKDFTVIFQAFEDEVTVFNLSINVPDKTTAELILKKWQTNPENIYSEFINIIFK